MVSWIKRITTPKRAPVRPGELGAPVLTSTELSTKYGGFVPASEISKLSAALRGGKVKSAKEYLKRIEAERIRQEAVAREKIRLEKIRLEKIRLEKIRQEKRAREQRLLRERLTRQKVIKQIKQAAIIRQRQKQLEEKPVKPIAEIRAVKKPEKKLERLTSEILTKRKILETKLERGKKLPIEKHIKLAGLVTAQTSLEFLTGLIQLPKTLVTVAKDPTVLKEVPSALKKEGKQFGQLLRVSPTSAVAKIGTEIVLLKGTAKGFKMVGKITGKASARLSPKFKGVKKGVITIPSQIKGKTVKIEIGGTVKELGVPLKVQAKLAGKEVTAVSAQGDKLVNLIKTKRVIRKPIPGEVKLSTSTKKLLTKFDKGTINKKDLIKLNKNIIIETKGEGSLLERSFFADPKGRLRPSRLKLKDGDASLLDVLSGDVSFKASKPQVLIFEKTKVQQFPKTKTFNQIKSKLKSGKTLTKSEADELLKFQLKTSGKFKPIGALTKEPEITLAPGEIIKKEKTIAVTIINGKKVPIVRAKIIKATKKTKDLLKKADKGTIKVKELKELRKRLKTETGFTPSLSRSSKVKPRVRLSISKVPRRKVRKSTRSLDLFIDVDKKVRRRAKKPTRRRPTPRPKPRKPTPTTPRRPTPRRPVKPPIRPPIIPPRLKKVKKKVPLVKRKQGYSVYVRPLKKKGQKKIPKLIKINKVPLSKVRAEDLRNYIIDTSLARTGKIKPSGKMQKPRLKVPSSYSSKTKYKFRKHKIRKKKRIPLKKGKVIEKRKRLLDTPQEKKQITLARRIAQVEKQSGIRPQKRKKTIRKAPMRLKIQKRTPIKPKRTLSQAQLNALAKGRRKRMQNLAKKKR